MDDKNTTGQALPEGEGSEPFNPAESLRLIGEQQARTRSAVAPDGRLLFAVWGSAWLIGYFALWISSTDTSLPPPWWGTGAQGPSSPAFVVFTVAIALAVIFTIVHSVRRSAGVRGVSSRAGILYGWSWMIGFAAMTLVLGGLMRAGASDVVIALASNAFACAVVGLLYLGGGIAFRDIRLYILGAWILGVAGLATLAGAPLTYLILATLGGGGILLMGLVEHVVIHRHRRNQVTSPGGW